jgi:uncharacterized coiled-coil protein SlyX
VELQETIPLIAQQPASSPPGTIAISTETALLTVGGILFSVAVAAGKWLISREFTRLEGTLTDLDTRLKTLEATQATQQVEAATIARLDRELASLERQQAGQSTELAGLAKVATQLERLTEAQGELKERVQRMDNVGYALTQAQELIKTCQKDLLQLEASIAKGFVSEEKFVRDMTVLTSRVDAVWERIDDAIAPGRSPRLLQEGDHGYR